MVLMAAARIYAMVSTGTILQPVSPRRRCVSRQWVGSHLREHPSAVRLDDDRPDRLDRRDRADDVDVLAGVGEQSPVSDRRQTSRTVLAVITAIIAGC